MLHYLIVLTLYREGYTKCKICEFNTAKSFQNHRPNVCFTKRFLDLISTALRPWPRK